MRSEGTADSGQGMDFPIGIDTFKNAARTTFCHNTVTGTFQGGLFEDNGPPNRFSGYAGDGVTMEAGYDNGNCSTTPGNGSIAGSIPSRHRGARWVCGRGGDLAPGRVRGEHADPVCYAQPGIRHEPDHGHYDPDDEWRHRVGDPEPQRHPRPPVGRQDRPDGRGGPGGERRRGRGETVLR